MGPIVNADPQKPVTRIPGGPNGQRGATLVEIMVATLILAIIALGMVEFFAKGRTSFNREEHKRTATLLAQEALERTTSLPYDQINPWGEQRTVGSVSYRITVATQPDAPETDITTVLCSVTWQSAPSIRSTASLATYVYDN